MASKKHRYYIWLFRAYFKRMKTTIIGSLIIGIIVFFGFIGLLNYYLRPLIFKTTQNVGYAGTYTLQNIPDQILNEVSFGLTKMEKNGEIKPGAAESWSIKDDKVYTFKLRHGLYFHNGTELTVANVRFNYENVSVKVIDKYTIQYVLKDPYSPFLSVVSHPILTKDFAGLGMYKLKNIDLNGGFIRTLELQNTQSKNSKKKIFFYPTQKALKIAFMLGEVDEIVDASGTTLDDINLTDWKNIKITEGIDYRTLVAIFYNNNDNILGNKKIRQALNYALPSKVSYGERSYGPIAPNSIYFEQSPTYRISDAELARTLLSTIKEPIDKPLTITTTEEFGNIAKDVQKSWKNIGINSTVKIITEVPSDFQVFLYRIRLPLDPDQYILWHSDQRNNIVHYKNLRIDKLLEDGRSISDVDKRQKIYADFQKYLNDDVPASFFYFPKVYDIKKK